MAIGSTVAAHQLGLIGFRPAMRSMFLPHDHAPSTVSQLTPLAWGCGAEMARHASVTATGLAALRLQSS
jgi:hypothetical protein